MSPKQRQTVAAIAMTDEDRVREFHRVIGVGSVYGYKARRENWKPMWIWQTRNRESVQHVIASLWNWLGPRRRDAAKVALIAWKAKRAYARKGSGLSRRGKGPTVAVDG